MKIFVKVLLFLMAGVPAVAAPGISVQQLTDIVGSAEARGQPDKDIARKIAGIELSQRLTAGNLASLLGHAPGEQTKEALQTLADESSFLDPPVAEIPNQPSPTGVEQKAILERARNYTIGYVGKLPNFLCTLTVRRFDDDNSGKRFRLRDTVVGDLTLNAGRESTRVRMVNGAPSIERQLTWGLRTHDEIGGLLAGVFADDSRLRATWSHWESLDGRRVAVFRYSLDKAHSHYTVSYCCRPGVVDVPTTIPTAAEGELFIDPPSGVILRITEQAVGIQIGFPIRKAAIMVEYAAVPIGRRSFICPVRSITLSDLTIPDAMALDAYSPSVKRSLNEMQFSNYHEFHAETRIVTSAASQPAAPAPSPAVPEPRPPRLPPAPAGEVETTRESLPPPAKGDVPNPNQASPPTQASTSVPAAPPPEAASPSPAVQTAGNRQSAPTMSFKVRVNLVTVRAVVRDSQGRFVDDLHKDDFELFDNSTRQVISGFSVEKPTSLQAREEPDSPQKRSSEQAVTPKTVVEPATGRAPDLFVAYLFDDLHSAFGDLSAARKAAQRVLAESSEPNTRVAISSTSGRVILDFTNDRTKLAQTLARIKPISMSPSAHPTCPPELSYYLADQILDKVNTEALNLAIMEEEDCGSKSPQLEADTAARMSLNQHEDEVRAAMSVLKATVSRLAMMPGQRTIVLVSPGFMTSAVSQDLDDVIDRASQNGIVINTMDARGLYVPVLAENIENPNSAAASNPEEVRLRGKYDRAEQTTRSDVLGQLANGTGGTFFQNSNDLYAGFKQLADMPEVFYLLGFKPQNLKADRAYHKLRVRITDRKGLEVMARDGYYAPKKLADPSEQAKEEIQNAVFSRNEIQDIPTALEIQPPATNTVSAKLVIVAHVDVRSIAFQEHDGRSHNSLIATFSLFDHDGKYIHGQQNKIEMNYPSGQLAAKLAAGLNLKSEFDAKSGRYLVRLVLRDEQGQMSACSKMVEIP